MFASRHSLADGVLLAYWTYPGALALNAVNCHIQTTVLRLFSNDQRTCLVSFQVTSVYYGLWRKRMFQHADLQEHHVLTSRVTIFRPIVLPQTLYSTPLICEKRRALWYWQYPALC